MANIKLSRLKWFISFLVIFFHLSILDAKMSFKIQQVQLLDYPYRQVEVSLTNIVPVGDLHTSNFKVFENDWEVSNFQVKKSILSKEPKHIILLVNSSSLLSLKNFNKQINSIRFFINDLKHADKISIISFGNTIQTPCTLISEVSQIHHCLNQIKHSGQKMVIYDAINAGMNALNTMKSRNFMILFASGKDQGSVMLYDTLLSKLRNTTLTLFVIATGDDKQITPLAHLAKLSGGSLYYTHNIQNIQNLYSLLQVLLNNSYLIRYPTYHYSTLYDHTPVQIKIQVQTSTFVAKDVYTLPIDIISFHTLWQIFSKDTHYLLLTIISIIFLGLFLLLLSKLFFRNQVPRDKNQVTKNKYHSGNADDITLYLQEDIHNNITEENDVTPIKQQHPIQDISGQPYIHLFSHSTPSHGAKYYFQYDVMTFGYGDNNTVKIEDTLLSYKHAQITRSRHYFVLYDLLSETGTYLNGKKILRPKTLEDKDIVTIGKTKLVFYK